MDISNRMIHRTVICIAPMVFALAGCAEKAPTASLMVHEHHASQQGPAHELTAGDRQTLAQLRAVTIPFQDVTTARNAGWDFLFGGTCFSDPQLGGMGYHYVNRSILDGTVDSLNPEALLYEPEKNGQFKFVAVEYVVPKAAWPAGPKPHLFGQDFHENGDLWILHVWHLAENPSGMFQDWNPKVSCEFAL